jgi:hypothetical protein
MIACHRGEANGMHRGDIWDLMMIELWHRQHVDNRAARVVSSGDGRSKEAVGIS